MISRTAVERARGKFDIDGWVWLTSDGWYRWSFHKPHVNEEGTDWYIEHQGYVTVGSLNPHDKPPLPWDETLVRLYDHCETPSPHTSWANQFVNKDGTVNPRLEGAIHPNQYIDSEGKKRLQGYNTFEGMKRQRILDWMEEQKAKGIPYYESY